ncbi:MAG: response regulator, partial [Rhodospirillaceae bacterium]
MPGTILVVDDDAHIRDVVGFALEKAGYRTVAAADGAAALAAAAAHAPDLIVLDINMPEVDGLEVCRRLRQTSEVPVLFLSSRDEEVDRIVGLELGGDDYVAKPFSPRELVARVKAILKRLKPPAPADDGALAHGALRLDPAGHQAWFGDTPVALTATEFTLL